MLFQVLWLLSLWTLRVYCSRNNDFLDLNPGNCPEICGIGDDMHLRALAAYWRGDYGDAFALSCQYLLESKKKSGLMKAIINDMSIGPSPLVKLPSSHFTLTSTPSRQKPNVILRNWEVLGPLPVGKLEVDGDPTFMTYSNRRDVPPPPPSSSTRSVDIAKFLLSMDTAEHIHSETMTDGYVEWHPLTADRSSGSVLVPFSDISWNDLAHGTSSFAALEFQAWARSSTFIAEEGQYSLHCMGVHTVYVRHANHTSILSGDVYRGGLMRGSLRLTAGPVGIVLPLRGSAGTQFSCMLTQVSLLPASAPTVEVRQAVQLLSQAVHFTPPFPPPLGMSTDSAMGLLLSPYFRVVLENPHATALNVSFRLVDSRPLPGRGWQVRVATSSFTHSQTQNDLLIEAGQVMTVPLELYTSTESPTTPAPSWQGLLVPCNTPSPSPALQLVIHTTTEHPSPPAPLTLPLHFTCRSLTQSFLLSYLDHDGSIAEAAVLLPLRAHHELKHTRPPPAQGEAYPALLSLHGTGIPPLSQADAYKHMPLGHSAYEFGVRDFWVIAPSRHGAHNWEGVGGLSARTALQRVREYFAEVPFLPQVAQGGGIAAGHSMGMCGCLCLQSKDVVY